MDGLSQEHAEELHGSGSPERYDELRRQYENNEQALLQIDIYDGSTEYHEHFRSYWEAQRAQDLEMRQQEEQWFEDHGYAGL